MDTRMDKEQKSGTAIIRPYLETGSHRFSRIMSYTGLTIGVLLLLFSAQMYLNINQLLKDKNPRKNGYDFISVTKTVTNQNMGQDNRFSMADVEELRKQPFITDAAPLLSNQFRTKASAGNVIPFSTDLFLESVKDDFLDTLPPNFTWKPGQQDIPIVFSADFLEMYNVFAPAQELPQLSSETIQLLNIVVECYSRDGMETYRGHIVALSDRINSVLVPESFLTWANQRYGNTPSDKAARVYIKTTDANSAGLIDFLESKNYHVNKDKTKFGRAKTVLTAVVGGLGFFSILVILLAMLLFSFYLQLMIARSKDNLQLLHTLGYSPAWLTKTVSRKWIPVYFFIIITALALTAVGQFIFSQFSLNGKDYLPIYPSPLVVALAIGLLLLCVTVNHRLIKGLLYKL